MKPSGAHTHPDMHGGGGTTALLVVVLVIVVAAIAAPVAKAASDALHVLVDIVEIAAIAVGAGLGLAAIGGVTFVVVRSHRRRLRATAPQQPRVIIRQQAEAVQPAPDLAELHQRLAHMEALLTGHYAVSNQPPALEETPTPRRAATEAE